MTSWIASPASDAAASAVRFRARLRGIPASVWITSLVVVSTLARFLVSLTSSTPWLVPDELIYGLLSRSFADGGQFVIRGEPFSALSFGPAYPMLIAPAFALTKSIHDAYMVVKAVNAVMFSLAVVPAYLIARRYVDKGWAVTCAGLALLVPSGVYTSKIMTESLAYPVFLLAILVLIRAVERPSTARDLVALATIAAATLTRAQMIVLYPAFLSAVATLALGDSTGSPASAGRRIAGAFGRHRALTAVTALGTAVAAGAAVLDDGFAGTVLGDHTKLLDKLRPLGLPQWIVYHLADLELYCGVIPVLAFVIVSWQALRGAPALARLRPFAAVTASVAVWLLLLIGLYGTQRRAKPLIFDRYLFYLVPLFVIALTSWLAAGMPGTRRLRRVAVVTCCVLPLLLPLSVLSGGPWGTSSSTVGLLPWVVVGNVVGHGWLLKLAMLLFCVSLAKIVLRPEKAQPRRVLRLVALNLVGIAALATVGNTAIADIVRGYSGHADRGWIGAATRPAAHVAAVWEGYELGGERGGYAIWENEIFNRNLDRVIALEEPLPDELPYTKAHVRSHVLVGTDGHPVRVEYLLADRRLRVKGQIVASDRNSGLVLRRIDGIVRLGR